MSRLSTTNLLYPPFARRLVKGLKAANAAGIPLEIFETYRTFERQGELYAQGRSAPGKIVTRARSGRSWHNYGIATDLVLKIDGKWSWEHEHLYVKAAPYLESCGLQWLGREPKFMELVHYQLPVELSIYEVEALYRDKGLIAFWMELNKRYGDKDLWTS
jgi:peptidoglycan L-alanyl-D-glutamate endopeptidase CwlK